ncbi:MAG: DUF1542 domain-containing protein, partial [Candidatus Paceibacterota bacterium]
FSFLLGRKYFLHGFWFLSKTFGGYPLSIPVQFCQSIIKLSNLIQELILYGKKQGFVFTEEMAEKSLLSFLKENNLGFLKSNDNLLPQIEESQSARYIVAKYIHQVKKSDDTLFKILVDVAVGVALANTLIYGESIDGEAGNINGLNIYFDTGFLFKLMGMNGPEQEQAFAELTQDLISAGAKLFVFQHTYDEMMGILTNAAYRIQEGYYDINKASRALKYFLNENFSASEVEMFLIKVSKTLEKFNIVKISKPEYSKNEVFQINEEELKNEIISLYKKSDPFFDEIQKDETINKDIASIYSICKLRQGHVAYTLKDASHVFVTTNSNLAWVSNTVQSADNVKASIPPCINDVLMGTLVWLQQPAKTFDLNEKKLIADAYAAMQPDKYLIERFIKEIEILQKEGGLNGDEVYLLRTQRAAYTLLSEITKNDCDNFDKRTPREIMDELNRDHLLDLNKALETKNRELANSNLENARKEEERQDALSKLEHMKREAKENIKNVSQKNICIAQKLEKTIHLIAEFLTWVVMILLVGLFVYCSYVNYFVENLSQLFKTLISSGALIISILGINLFNAKKYVYKYIKQALENKFA